MLSEKPPKYLVIGLTNLCTTRCTFCYRRDLHRKPLYFPFGRYKSLIDELGPDLHTLEFSGIGEPLLHTEFKEFARYARDQYGPERLALGLVSNGSLLTRDISESLVAHQFSYVWISLNAATPGTHAALMPGLSFDTILNSIREFIATRARSNLQPQPLLRISFLVNKQNYFEAESFLDLGVALGADSVELRCVDAALEPTLYRRLHVSESDFGAILERIETRAAKDKRISYAPRWVFWPDRYGQPDQERAEAISCGNADEVFGVYLSSGEVTFCCYMAANLETMGNALGSVYESSALDIWNGARARTFVESLRDVRRAPSVCKQCLNYWNKKWVRVTSETEGTRYASD